MVPLIARSPVRQSHAKQGSARCYPIFGRRPVRAVVHTATIAVGVAMFGCDSGPTTVCTEIGCNDELIIVLAGNVPTTYTITAIADNGDERTRQCSSECDGNVSCRFTPEKVTIVVTWQGGSIQQTVEPTYASYYPNGPTCPPKCRRAIVSITLGASSTDNGGAV